jgi:L-gulono-1,4-lactone dehydrogenase
MSLREKVTLRKRWRNDTGNQGVDPLGEVTPRTLEQLCEAVREAEQDGCTVRAVGSGHSWSDVALTDGLLVKPTGLTDPLDLELEVLRPGMGEALEGGARLVRVQAGMTIAKLNAYLESLKLALPNMGGFDGQTVAGVISTSTHGSGFDFGPLSDLVRSLDIVGAEGVVYRVEPLDGPTNPVAYGARYRDRRLEQDDRWFRAVAVGMGCMGLIHSAILEVAPLYYLREVRSMSTWSQVREQLESGSVPRGKVHYEVYLNPYPRKDGEIECLVTTRSPVDPAEFRRDHRRRRSLLMELTARFPLTPALINLALGLWPKIAPFLIAQALKALVNEDYVNISYKVLNIGAANFLPAYSCEIGVPFDDRHLYVQAVERIVAVAGQRAQVGEIYHSSPISLRFVRGTDAFMSMMQGHSTMMIELIMATHTRGGEELLSAHENALYGVGGRPHWGQLNSLTGSHGFIAEMYPYYEDWQAVHAELNSSGVFDSPFSKRVGISRSRFFGR